MHITAVIPLCNESATLQQLYAELREVANANGYRLRTIFVDDGSTDDSWRVVSELAESDDRVLGIRFRRNFGKAAALTAGFDAAEDPVVVTMDADLQDDPAELPRMLAKLAEGYDVVSGWKQVRHDPLDKVLPSRIFNWLVSEITGVRLHDHNCGFKCYRRDVLHEVRLYGELHRFVPVLAAARGFRIAEAPVNHRAREFGKSKYGASRIVKGFLDLLTVKFLTGYGQRPLHPFGSAGIAASLVGGLGLTWLAARWGWSRLFDSVPDIHLHETASLFYSLALLFIGAQLLTVGLLGEMITAFLARDVDTYSIAEHTSPSGEATDPGAAAGAVDAPAKGSPPTDSHADGSTRAGASATKPSGPTT
ncbi:MAG: glycosyltransferase family 2 protein [Planctomycetota bacterium]